MLGWISILIGIVLIIANLKSVWDRTTPLRASAYNNVLTSMGYTPTSPTSSASPTDTPTPDPNAVGLSSISTGGASPNNPSSVSGDKTNTGYQSAPSSSTDTPPAPTDASTANPSSSSSTTTPTPPTTSPVGSTSPIWPVEFFITTDVIAVLAGIALIYFGIKAEYPPAPPALMGGRRRRR